MPAERSPLVAAFPVYVCTLRSTLHLLHTIYLYDVYIFYVHACYVRFYVAGTRFHTVYLRSVRFVGCPRLLICVYTYALLRTFCLRPPAVLRCPHVTLLLPPITHLRTRLPACGYLTGSFTTRCCGPDLPGFDVLLHTHTHAVPTVTYTTLIYRSHSIVPGTV